MKNLILILVFACLASHSWSQGGYTLKQAQEYAIKNAFSVKSTQYDALVAKLTSDALLGTGLPQVNASMQYNNYIDLPTSLVPAQFFGGRPGEYAKLRFGVPQNMTAGVSATQLLFNGTWLVGLEASKAYAELQKKNTTRAEIEIKNAVAQAYCIALISEKNLKMMNESREILAKMLADSKQLNENGFVEIQDVEQLQLNLNNMDIRRMDAEQQVALTKDVLKFTMGMPLSESIELTEDIEAMANENSLELLNSSFDAGSSIDIQVAKDGMRMRALNLKAEKSKLLPTAAAFYNLQAQAQRDEFNFQDTSLPWFPIQLWGVQLSVPIFSGLSKSKNIEIAKVQLQQTTDMVNYSMQAKQLEYNKASGTFRTAFETYQSSKASMELSDRILTKTRIKYNEGMSSSFEIAQIQSQNLAAQGQYIGAMMNLMNARIALLKSLNQL